MEFIKQQNHLKPMKQYKETILNPNRIIER